MSITTYAQLQTSVASWLHRSDLTAIIPDLIMLGEKRIFREARCWPMEAVLTGTTASGVVALPNDYLELKFARITGAPNTPLTGATASQIYEQYPLRSASGKPKLIGREYINFIFGPYPDDGLILAGIYYKQPVSIDTSANDLFLFAPDLYLFAALAEAGDYTANEKSIIKWEAKYASILEKLNEQDAGEVGSGGGMRVTAA